MTPFEPREWAFFSISAGVVTIMLGGVASTILVGGGAAADLLCIASVILIADGAFLIGCGCKFARLGATLQDQTSQIKTLSRRLEDFGSPESLEPDIRIKPAP